MRNDLKIKFLQHFNQKKGNEGFTLIELLVVIIIIGILSAIALPSFLNQSNKAKLTEAKNNIRLASEAQKAHFVQYGEFITATDASDAQALNAVSTDVNIWTEALGVSPVTETDNYEYYINNAATGTQVSMVAVAKSPAVKGYFGSIMPLRGVVDQVYCTAVRSVAEGGTALTSATSGTFDTTNGVSCPNTTDWESSK